MIRKKLSEMQKRSLALILLTRTCCLCARGENFENDFYRSMGIYMDALNIFIRIAMILASNQSKKK